MATVDSVLETLLNEHDVARITGLSVASVRRWRLLRQGRNTSRSAPPSATSLKTFPRGWKPGPPAAGNRPEGRAP